MWPRLLGALTGVWLMAAPSVLAYGDPAMTSDRIVGPLAASFAIIAIWEATRPVRWAIVPLGAWLLVAPLVLGYGTPATINSIATAAVLIATASVRGPIRGRFDGGWRMIWRGS